MAREPSRNLEINRILRAYEVNQQQEDELMFLYTETVTRELVFAVDLMDIVMKQSNLRLLNCTSRYCCGRLGPSDFDEEIKKFVELTLAYKLKAGALQLMEVNLELDRVTYEEFKRFANASALKTEDMASGEDLEDGTLDYWMFCITMAEMCTIAYQRGLANAPIFGIMLMVRTFTNFDIKSAFPPYPWFSIKHVAYQEKARIEMRSRRRLRSIQRDLSGQDSL